MSPFIVLKDRGTEQFEVSNCAGTTYGMFNLEVTAKRLRDQLNAGQAAHTHIERLKVENERLTQINIERLKLDQLQPYYGCYKPDCYAHDGCTCTAGHMQKEKCPYFMISQKQAEIERLQVELDRLKAQLEQIDTVRSGLPCDHVWGTSGYSPALDAPVAAVCMKCGTSGESARNGWIGCNPKPEPVACNHVWNSGYGGERNGSFTDAVAVCVKCGECST